VPEQARDFLEETVETYRTQLEPRARLPKPKNRDLVEGIERIVLTGLRDLWTDSVSTFPDRGQSIQWEVWLRPGTTDRFRAIAADRGLRVGGHPLVFPEDVAILVEGTPEQLEAVVDATVSVSRLARAKRASAFLIGAATEEQLRAMDELLSQIDVPQGTDNTLCLLDTGVNHAHPLLAPVLRAADCHAYESALGQQ